MLFLFIIVVTLITHAHKDCKSLIKFILIFIVQLTLFFDWTRDFRNKIYYIVIKFIIL